MSVLAPCVLVSWAPCLSVHAEPPINPAQLSESMPTDPARIDYDQTLVRRLEGNPGTLNALLAGSALEWAVLELLHDRLFVFDRQMQWMPNPAMVERYEESDDHLRAVVTLKEGLRWHDGSPFTAADIVFSYERLTDPRVPAAEHRSGVAQIAECQATGDRTLTFVHRQASPVARLNLGFPVVPKHLYAPLAAEDPTLCGSESAVQRNRRPVGNGPYRFVEWAEDERLVLERWDDYPGPRPAFRRIVLRIMRDPQAALLALLKGEIHETRLSPADFSREVNAPEFARVAVAGKADQWHINYIGWNMSDANPFFGDVRVRRAMSHALDVEQIIRNVYGGLYSRAAGIYPPSAWMFNPEVKPMAHDPRRAEELLDAAGWKLDPDSGWRMKDGVAFAFELLYPQESATGRQALTFYQQGLRALGVDVKLKPVEFAALRELRARREFQAFYGAWATSDDPDKDRGMWESSAREGGANFVGYKNEQVDALFAEAGRTFDFERRRQYYQEVHRLIQEDQPFTFVSISPTLWAFNKHLRGVGFGPRGIFFWHPGPRGWWVQNGDTLRAN